MKFRKKPIVIEAYQLTDGDATAPTPRWLIDAVIIGQVVLIGSDGKARIKTLEGTMTADLGDWIIRGVKGELYPCKPDIFAATYDPVQAAKAPQFKHRF